jgi:hypothetical protein
MKKTYINPELEVVKLQTMQMLASSVNLGLSEETITDEENLLSPSFDDEAFDFGTDDNITDYDKF